jgi:hypothetical protein
MPPVKHASVEQLDRLVERVCLVVALLGVVVVLWGVADSLVQIPKHGGRQALASIGIGVLSLVGSRYLWQRSKGRVGAFVYIQTDPEDSRSRRVAADLLVAALVISMCALLIPL